MTASLARILAAQPGGAGLETVLPVAPDGAYRFGAPAEVLDAQWLRRAYAIEARIEHCSLGQPLVLADSPLLKEVSPHAQ